MYQKKSPGLSLFGLGIGLENFGLKKSLGIGLENFGLKKSFSSGLKKFGLKKVSVTT